MPGPIGVALVITIVFLIILVRLAGLEPARPEGPRGLNPRRLPFRHNRKNFGTARSPVIPPLGRLHDALSRFELPLLSIVFVLMRG